VNSRTADISAFTAILQTARTAFEGSHHHPERFDVFLDVMFTDFRCLPAGTPVTGLPLPSVSDHDNLDTGNPHAGPWPLWDGVRVAHADDACRGYLGPETQPGLVAAVRRLAVATGVLGRDRAEDLAVQVGAGTVNLFDSTLRSLLHSPGDVLLVPDTTYGFFLPHAYRCHGEVVMVPTDASGRVRPDDLAAAIDRNGRARALLLINPTIAGAIYDRAHLARISAVAGEHGVTVIEDIAYLGLRTEPGQIGSVLDHTHDAVSLLGLSKPFGLSGLRIGVALAEPALARLIMRRVENSIGFVPAFVQDSVEAALGDTERALAFLKANNTGRPDSYSVKMALTLAVTMGLDDAPLTAADRRSAAAMIDDHAPSALARLLAVPELRQGAAHLTGRSPAAPTSELAVATVADLCAGGLRRWVRPAHVPEAGIFLLWDCAPLLGSPVAALVGLASSFDVFALLAHLVGVRTIPQETMSTAPAPDKPWLRITVSPDPEVLLEAFLRVQLGFGHLALLAAGSS